MMGGQQPITQSSDARVDYRKLCTIISEMDKKLDDCLKNCETRIAVQDTAIASLQNRIEKISGNLNRDENCSVSHKEEELSKWLHVMEATRICKRKYGVKTPFSDVSRALIWAGYLERQNSQNGSGYSYSVTEKGTGQNLIRLTPCNKSAFLINPEQIEHLAAIVREYREWFANARKVE